MVALLEELLRNADIEIAVVTASPSTKESRRHVQGVDFFVVPCQKHALQRCADIVREWRPDLVHIHGTERFYGLLSARKMIDTPTVISIQGLLGPYSEWYHYFGNSTLRDIIRMHRWLEIPAKRGQCWAYLDIRKRVKSEREILRGNQFFIGRTAWDHAHVKAMNPQATYFAVGELLRRPFWNSQWRLEECQRYRVIFTNAGHIRKGLEVLLDVIPLLKPDYPDIQVCIAGNISHRSGYGRYIRRKLRSLDANVVELGALNAKEMAAELVRSHIFVSPSFIDNSPNALCEAQLVGMPVISTYTGGVPSLVDDGKTGLFFPTGDMPTLAARLREVFENDSLAKQLGSRAREVAQTRHAPEDVTGALIRVYRDILRLSRMEQSSLSYCHAE
jgi:glycosyltransferase involved in cell wall biosynthesis